MTTLVIGDIHGCWDELRDLLDKAALGQDDQIVAVGDLIDRGPQPGKVLDFFGQTPNARTVMGNHERKHVRWRRGEVKPSLGQKIARRQLGQPGWEAACNAMETMPLWIELPWAIVVHGFFEPGVALEKQNPSVLLGTMTGERHMKAHGGRQWYERYDGDKPLIVGHLQYTTDHSALVHNERVFGLDTGASHGGRLTGLLLPQMRLISVPSRGDHWARVKADHADLRYTGTALEDLDWEGLERLVRRADADQSPHPDALERINALRRLHRRAHLAIEALHEHILTRTQALIEQDPSRAQDGGAFARALGPEPMASFYHLARRGALSPQNVHQRFATPLQAVNAALERGLDV